MIFFYFLLILLLLLLIITLLSTIIKFALLLTTRHNYETPVLIVPSILNFISWSLIFYFWSIVIPHITGKDILTIIFDNILNLTSLGESIVSILPITLLFIVFGLILQAFSFFAVNIPYSKIKNKIKLYINKLFKIELKVNNETKDIILNDNEEKLNMLNSFIASLFTFSLTLFIILLCLAIGNFISTKILTSLQAK